MSFLYHFIFYVNIKISGAMEGACVGKCGAKKMSHNVPAVYDVFASPIKETVGFQGLQKCGWS
jgi:hypothetical protein